MAKKESSKLNIAITHPDLGIVVNKLKNLGPFEFVLRLFESLNNFDTEIMYSFMLKLFFLLGNKKMLGGAERLIVDAAVELASHGHKVHIFTSHHDKKRCFE
ncbi:hypothetical protein FEM48_Zijuj12G0116400 [Ziziphus jujuba var. spinosa]|uniref:Glycosyltransferase subfamily 4-like N-terminal domain-containing protein n=1 Tax=Ziziphus jujuba var. spinosa TaxID=714518 RepID=A0A978UD36_ZIZJJ|nr:hypothetical protein FEM48_Zijuj12G0116400 [Ziziphus jujuba var. spinosa]